MTGPMELLASLKTAGGEKINFCIRRTNNILKQGFYKGPHAVAAGHLRSTQPQHVEEEGI